MDLVKWFSEKVMHLSMTDPIRARRLLLAGYRANLLTLKPPFPAHGQTPAKRLAASTVMKVIIKALAHPEDAALVSLFTPCEPLITSGIAPYSLEAVSGYLMGTQCETWFQEIAVKNGVPDTMCSFHRTFLGAAENGLLPKPRFVIYTSLACDGNMITFPYLQKKFDVPCFFIDVPYEKSEDAVHYVARQLEKMKAFIEDVADKSITDDALRATVRRSKLSAESYLRFLAAESDRRLSGDVTGEMYSAFMSHILLGSKDTEKYFSMLEKEIKKAPVSGAKRLLWIHAIPYMQPSLHKMLNFSDKVFITTCDLCYDSMVIPQDEHAPYLSMARRLVYSGYNGGPAKRVENAINMAHLTNADGIVIFAHWGCKATLGAIQLMKNELESSGLPTLVLDGDACSIANTSDGQLATRMEAFLEMLGVKK